MPEISSLIPIQVDLDVGLAVQPLRMTLAAGNANAHQLHFTALRSGVPVDLTGVQVSGACLRADGATIPLAGAIVNGAAVLTLSAACYAVPGLARLSLTLSYGSVTATHLLALLQVDANTTDLIVDPEGVLPSLAGLLAEIDKLRSATAAAEAAADFANQAASAALNTTLHLMGAAAPVIIQSASGDGVVSVSDSAERTLSGLSVYGKTTQAGTPTPEAPVELVNAGDSGSIAVSVRGKNLLKNTAGSTTMNGVTFTVHADGSVTANGTATATAMLSIGSFEFAAGTSYVINGCPPGGTHNSYMLTLRGSAYGAEPVYGDEYGGGKVFKPESNTIAYLLIRIASGTTMNNVTFRPMIRMGTDVDAIYDLFKDGGSMTASTPNGLPGIPVSSGGNYIDSTGQQWVCDEIDFTRKMYVKRVNSYAFTGGESWASQSTAGGYRARLVGVIADYKKPAANREAVNALCTHYAVVGAESTYNGTKNGVALEMNGTSVTAYDPSKTTDDVNVWKTYLAEQNAAGTPLSLLYQLATPIETPLSPEELTGSTSLTAQYPNTTAFNDGGAGMKMEYIADTKTYIDQRIAALLNA